MAAMRRKMRVTHPERPIGWVRSGLTMGQAFRAVLVAAGVAFVTAAVMHAKPARAQPASAQKATSVSKDEAAFRKFIESLWPEARARGVSRTTFDEALGKVTIDPSIGKTQARQAEFVRPIWDYVNGAVTPQRVERGRAMAREYGQTLSEISRRYGADPYVVLAIWGVETSYGSFTGNKNVFRSLATLVYKGIRPEFFRNELMMALIILQEGHVHASQMTGSWAGAMGHTQFMPSSFMKWAADYNGDRHKDIWNNIPDALASTANYLAQHGWKPGLPWGYEVLLPERFDVSPHDPQSMRGFAEWARMGVRRADGGALPSGGEAGLWLPAGARGPAFLVTANFRVIRSYNMSQAYMLAVALLSTRIAGGGPLAGSWPKGEKPLSTAQAKEIQRNLQRLGFNVGEIDGRIGEQVQGAIRAYQRKHGMVADGYATHALLERMRATR
ncbi:MAG: lytic murein transglycosylase [Beijerinckiaceae bacterium]